VVTKRIAIALAIACLAGCGQSTIEALVVETNSPAAGPDGTLVQAIGIETLGGSFTRLIPEGTQVPCAVSETFSTATDNQDQIMVTVFRGRGDRVADAHHLGDFQVAGIPPAPRGVPSIEITFAVRERKVLLSARDLASGRPLPITELSTL
jgi:molecular chaperone DnaK